MTDVLDTTSSVSTEPGVNGNEPVSTCQRPGCDVPLPAEGEAGYHRMRKYCDAHQPKKKPKLVPDDGEPVPPRVTNNVTVNLPKVKTSKADTEAAKVAAGAEAMLGLIPLVMTMVGDDVCPASISAAVPSIAAQLGELSKFHPVLRKVFAGGEGTGEVVAWIGLSVALVPVLLVVLVHHGLISTKVADRLSAFTDLGGLVNGSE